MKNTKKIFSIIAVLLLIWWFKENFLSDNSSTVNSPPTSSPSISYPLNSSQQTEINHDDADKIVKYYKNKSFKKMVSVQAIVTKILEDDVYKPRHQRFIVELSNQHTVLITHNIDLAPRVSGINEGDQVIVIGQYEWNERGGVIHWTHHDPQGLRQGGRIIHNGNTYQ